MDSTFSHSPLLPVEQAAEAEALFLGTWAYPREGSETGYLHFNGEGRAVDFYRPTPKRPELLVPWRLWYDFAPGDRIRFRPRAERAPNPDDAHLYHFSTEGPVLHLKHPDRAFQLTRPEEGAIPDWFHALVKMGLSPSKGRDHVIVSTEMEKTEPAASPADRNPGSA